LRGLSSIAIKVKSHLAVSKNLFCYFIYFYVFLIITKTEHKVNIYEKGCFASSYLLFQNDIKFSLSLLIDNHITSRC